MEGGGAVIQTLRYGGGWSPKKIFSALQASVWSGNKGGGRPPGPLSWIRHYKVTANFEVKCVHKRNRKTDGKNNVRE